jgi:hypothetical protein
MIDKELMEKLSKWETVFSNAIKLNFIHLSPSEFGEIANLYKAVFGKTLTKSQMGCNSCRLRSLKELATEYFSNKEKENNKPKRGRPKKIDIDGEFGK